ncbi:MAG: chaperone modulator CbpM [Pseudomonadota bacterium]|mgnify:CR=1 FL=1|nr:MAG: MerR family transcriptional regulator [Pseudomonadota bacterium]
MRDAIELLQAQLLGESDWIGVEDLCRLCRLELTEVIELAELGVFEPRGDAPERWLLPATMLPRLRTASRLIRDLGVNVSGAALVLDLLDMQRELERRVQELERLLAPQSLVGEPLMPGEERGRS